MQTKTETRVPVVWFSHSRLNYGAPRFVLLKDKAEADRILPGLVTFFGDDLNASIDHDRPTPAEFVAKHQLQVDSEDERDLNEAVQYDESNPEHVAWMEEVRGLLTA
jgi:hypothetical protein